jgi:hypothetical protein
VKSRIPPKADKKSSGTKAKSASTKAGKKKVAAKPKATATKSKPRNALREMMRGADRPVARDTDPRAPFSTGGRDRDVDASKPVRPRRG